MVVFFTSRWFIRRVFLGRQVFLGGGRGWFEYVKENERGEAARGEKYEDKKASGNPREDEDAFC